MGRSSKTSIFRQLILHYIFPYNSTFLHLVLHFLFYFLIILLFYCSYFGLFRPGCDLVHSHHQVESAKNPRFVGKRLRFSLCLHEAGCAPFGRRLSSVDFFPSSFAASARDLFTQDRLRPFQPPSVSSSPSSSSIARSIQFLVGSGSDRLSALHTVSLLYSHPGVIGPGSHSSNFVHNIITGNRVGYLIIIFPSPLRSFSLPLLHSSPYHNTLPYSLIYSSFLLSLSNLLSFPIFFFLCVVIATCANSACGPQASCFPCST